MPRRKSATQPPPGTFRPAVPKDAQEVLFLYAVAARIVCDLPDTVSEVDDCLRQVTANLVPPESSAAEECARLWNFFLRAAASPKPKLRETAGRALYHDLDSLGQRMELAPLASWSRLPRGIQAVDSPVRHSGTNTAITIDAVRRRARKRLEGAARGKRLTAVEVAELLRLLDRSQVEDFFTQLVGDGEMGKGEGRMVIRWLAKGEELSSEDEALIEFLERLGDWLARG